MDDGLNVEVSPAALQEKPVLRHLLELYKHDLSEFTGDDLDAHGLFGYGYLDHYWTEPARWPLLFRLHGRLAGFALVTDRTLLPESAGGHDLTEFFVLRAYRRRGVGNVAARQLFDRFPGRWEVRELAENAPAIAFWRRVIDGYTGGRYREVMLDDDRWRGPAQLFDARRQ
jgi:predicted acetyltransferase